MVARVARAKKALCQWRHTSGVFDRKRIKVSVLGSGGWGVCVKGMYGGNVHYTVMTSAANLTKVVFARPSWFRRRWTDERVVAGRRARARARLYIM